jgi:hypothetical protein
LKYLSSKTLGQVESKPGDSHFWQGLMEAKKLFWPFCRIVVGNGMNTRFWEDHWINDQPLSLVFPRLFSISLNHEITVSKAFAMGIRNLKFRRVIVGQKREQWIQMCVVCDVVTLSNDPDKLWWKLSKSGAFTVKSLYMALQNYGVVPYNFIWKIKIPARVKTFLWLMW